jgi:hypothetical protein
MRYVNSIRVPQNRRRKKTGQKAGFSINQPKPINITWLEQQQRPKQRSKQRQQPTRQPKQRSKQQQPKRQQLGLLLVRLRQQQELLEQLQLQEPRQLLELGSRWFLLFCCMRSEQQPSGRRSAGIFSWFFP